MIASSRTTKRRSTPRAVAKAVLLSLVIAGESASAQSLSEAEAVRRICRDGPDRAAADALRAAGSAGVEASGLWPNPSLEAGHERLFTGLEESETTVGLRVPLPVGGHLGLQEEAAVARAAVHEADAEGLLLGAALALRAELLGASVARARREVLGDHAKTVEGLAATIDGLIAGGERAPYDRLRTQAELRAIASLAEAASADYVTRAERVRAWVGAPVEIDALEPRALSAPTGKTSEPPPALRALAATAEASGAEARAAERRWVPVPELFAGYRTVSAGASTGHGMSFGLSLPLTFFDHGQGAARKAEAERALAIAELGRRERDLTAGQAAISAARMAHAQALARADEAVAAAALLTTQARRLYAAGEASIVDLHDAYEAQLTAELGRVEVLAHLAELTLDEMRTRGTQFDPSLDAACRTRGDVR